MEAGIVLVGGPYLSEGFITGQSEPGNVIHQLGFHTLPIGQESPTAIPGQNLHLVERQEVPNQVAAHEPDAMPFKDAELVRIGLARTTPASPNTCTNSDCRLFEGNE